MSSRRDSSRTNRFSSVYWDRLMHHCAVGVSNIENKIGPPTGSDEYRSPSHDYVL